MATPISTVTPFSGTAPAKEQEDTVFDANIDNELQFMNNLPIDLNVTIDELNTFGGEMEAIAADVENDATTATERAAIAEEWASTTDALVDATDYSAKEYAIGNTAESAKRHASGTVTTGSAKAWATSTADVADGFKGSRGYAQDSQAILSDVQSIAASIPVGQIDNGDAFGVDTSAWSAIRTAFETNSLPWKPIVNLDFARDNYEAYVGLSAVTTRAPLLDLATFTRASSATGVNAFGQVETVGANQPRVVFENGQSKGILLENAATNVATWSETDGTNYPIGSAANWAGNLQTVGGITLDDQTATPVISKDFSSSSSSAVASIFFYDDGTKDAAGSKQVFRLECRGDTIAVANIFFDYATKSFSITLNPSYIAYDAEKIGGGLYRIFLKCNSSPVTNITAYRVATYSDATYNNTLGGLQVVLGSSTPSSYIKTEGTSVVRAADDFSYAWLSGFDGNGDWTLLVDVADLPEKSVSSIVGGLTTSSGTFNDSIYILKSSSNTLNINSGSNIGVNIPLGVKPDGVIKIALRHSSGIFSACVNGGGVVVDSTGTALDFSELVLARSPWSNDNYANSKTRQIKIYPTALPDIVCQAITGV